MFASSPLSLPTRDRIAIVSALVGVTVLAWAYILYVWAMMPAMNMDAPDSMMEILPWMPADFVFMFFMWAIMMVGMMLPSAAPMTMLYAGMVRKAERQGTPMPSTAAFVSGYLAMWCVFSVGATLLQWGLHQAALLSSMMITKSQVLGGGLLLMAGLYQLTPWKNVCLDHCRSPAHFFSHHWRPGVSGAFRLGLEHGAFCLGCCWALMGLLFFGGVMNLLWIAGIAIFVFLEKVLPFGVWGGRLAGGGLIALGLLVLLL